MLPNVFAFKLVLRDAMDRGRDVGDGIAKPWVVECEVTTHRTGQLPAQGEAES